MKDNMTLKNELLSRSEELKIKTTQRDLSTQTVEMAYKKHVESFKKMAKLEAECHRLKGMTCKSSLVNNHKSESLIDCQSDNGERLNEFETDVDKMCGTEPSKCEPNCSDLWAYALIVELDQFKNEKFRELSNTSLKIDLMDDFLEMEWIFAFPGTKNESFHIMSLQMNELKRKFERVEKEKGKLNIIFIVLKHVKYLLQDCLCDCYVFYY